MKIIPDIWEQRINKFGKQTIDGTTDNVENIDDIVSPFIMDS